MMAMSLAGSIPCRKMCRWKGLKEVGLVPPNHKVPRTHRCQLHYIPHVIKKDRKKFEETLEVPLFPFTSDADTGQGGRGRGHYFTCCRWLMEAGRVDITSVGEGG